MLSRLYSFDLTWMFLKSSAVDRQYGKNEADANELAVRFGYPESKPSTVGNSANKGVLISG